MYVEMKSYLSSIAYGSQSKTALGCKKGTAKQSRINAITEYDW